MMGKDEERERKKMKNKIEITDMDRKLHRILGHVVKTKRFGLKTKRIDFLKTANQNQQRTISGIVQNDQNCLYVCIYK